MSNQQTSKTYKHLDVITSFFVLTLILSNLFSSAKLVDLGISLLGTMMIFDGGLLIFPLCYVFGDILTEVYGYRKSRKVIWLGFLACIITSICVQLLRILPGESSWLLAGGQKSYDTVLYGFYSGGIVTASIFAYLLGEFLNSYVLAKMKIFSKGKKMGMRFIGSTIVGQLADSLAFFSIACLFGVFSWELWLSLVITNYILKVLVEVCFLPITLRIVLWLKKSEQSDHYDYETNFSPILITK